MPGPSLPAAIHTLSRVPKVSPRKSGAGSTHDAADAVQTGTRNGLRVETKPSGTSKHSQRASQARQRPGFGQDLQLSARRASADALDNILSPDEIHQLAAVVPNYRPRLSQAARRILLGESIQDLLPAGSGGPALEMAAYHLALQCLSPQGDPQARRERMTALLTPLPLVSHDPQSVAKLFQDAVNPDAEEQEELVNLLIELKGGGARIEDPGETARRLCTPGRDARGATIDDQDALMAWLRGVLNLPPVDDRAQRYEAVREDLRNLRASSRGAIVAKMLAQQDSVSGAAAPEPRADGPELEDHDPDFLDRLSGLLNSFSFEQLHRALNDNKRRAGEKLPQKFAEGEAPAVRDAELGATNKELGDLHVASTLVMFVKNTVDYIRRTGHGTLDGTQLLRGMVMCLQADPPDARHYRHLLESLGVNALVAKIVLLTNLKNVVQGMPSKCFASNETRIAAVNAIQMAIDPYVDAEEDVAAPSPTVAAEAR